MPITEKKKASNKKWDDANIKRLSLAVPMDMYARMQKHIQESGETMNGFIKKGIELALLSAFDKKQEEETSK